MLLASLFLGNRNLSFSPHPEEPRSGVSKDEGPDLTSAVAAADKTSPPA
jgi:hypothetical protein